MAEDPWNKINIPFPSALSFVRIPIGQETGSVVIRVLGGIHRILTLLESEVLQTEIRLMYELLYIVNNNLGKTKIIRVLKQVEQCTNRLKMMKLDVALQDLKDLCPRKNDLSKRLRGVESAECDVPSQPMLEWVCLKVLGAAQLLSCVLHHCTRAFILSNQQLQSRDFVVVNGIINCMLSRMWVFFRGLRAHLAPLYQLIMRLLSVVAEVRPMPFLTDFSLPADMDQFLGPSDASSLTIEAPRVEAAPRHVPRNDRQNRAEKRKAVENKAVKEEAVLKKMKPTRKERGQWREELGHVVERDKISNIIDMKSLLKIFRGFTKAEDRSFSQDPAEIDQKTVFKKRVKAATTFADMAAHLEEMIPWCKSQNLRQEKRCLAFLHLKCRKMKCLESAGYNVQRKLRSFKREACWASSPRGSVPRTCLSAAALGRRAHHRRTAHHRRRAQHRRRAHRRTRLQLLRARFRPTATRVCVKRKRTESSEQGSDEAHASASRAEFTPQTSACVDEEDIDDIFASIGF